MERIIDCAVEPINEPIEVKVFDDIPDIFEAVAGVDGFVFSVVLRQDAALTAQDEEGEGDIAVLVGFEQASEEIVGDVLNEVCEFLVVCHGVYIEIIFD